MTNQAIQRSRYNARDKRAFGLFWSWNIIFLAFLLLGFVPQTMPNLIEAVRTGTVPVQYVIYGFVLVSIPIIAVILGFTVLRHKPRRLFTLGYAVEGPLMLLLLIRFFLIRQATPPVTMLSVIAVIGIAAFMWNLLDLHPQDRPVYVRYLKVFGLTLYMLLALYASVWVAFYALPMLMSVMRSIVTFLLDFANNLSFFWRNFVEFIRLGSMLLFNLLGFILLLYTGTLVVLMPVVVPILAVRAWLRALRALPTLPTRRAAGVLSGATITLTVVLMVLAAQQPQHRAFALLSETPQSAIEAQNLIAHEETIRKGLLNAYLAPVRYLSSVGDVNHITDFYVGAFKMEEDQARSVQNLYEWVIRPLLYEPVEPVPSPVRWEERPIQTEPIKAAQLYESFFDEPIHIAERDTVVRAVRSTWNAEMAQIAWQAVDDREIRLVTQEVNVSENGDWAEVELYEVYQNQTWQEQEVVYYFSLPESAVLTGVWLNDRPDRESRFVYQVAPRGAAQAIYRNELVVQRDPALLEQIGPRQYRLRVYPVAPIRWATPGISSEPVAREGPPMHMWLTYRVMAQDGGWPMPQLSQVRNVYWDADTQRKIPGPTVMEEDWLPLAIPATNQVAASPHQYTFPNGETIVAVPLDSSVLPALPDDIRLAVVLDRSRSMQESVSEVDDALEHLSNHEQNGASVDMYLTSSVYRGEAASQASLEQVRAQERLYFGGQNASELLAQYTDLSQNEQYDAVLLLTDGSGYELGPTGTPGPVPDAPLWLVHVNNEYTLGYDDATLEAIQASGGGVAGSLEEALNRIAVGLNGGETLAAQLELPAGSSHLDVLDGYVWLTYPADSEGIDVLASTRSEGFDAFAARRVILSEMGRNRGDLSNLAILDSLHAIAVEHHVVTPYSSMIVLVNEQQRKNLERLEGQDDRFAREFEGSGDTVPQNFSVTGVPEPEEWLLLALMVGLLAWFYRKSLKEKLNFGQQGRIGMG